MPRKKKHPAQYWEVERGKQDDDTFSPIYNSLLKSQAFKSLHPSAQIVLIFCHNQSTDRMANKCLYAHKKTHPFDDPTKDPTDNPKGKKKKEVPLFGLEFVFPAKHAEQYGMKRQNLNRALEELTAAGFIRVKEQNQNRKLVNVYEFSPEWHDWTPAWFEERKRRIEEQREKKRQANRCQGEEMISSRPP